MKEKEIIAGCKRGDRLAYRAFVDNYSAFIYSICYRYMGNGERAKDAVQECLMQVINKIDKYEDIGRFKSWVGAVTVKKCLDQLRKEKRHNHGDLEHIAEPSEQEQVSRTLEYQQVLEFINQIPDKYRVAINMFLVEGYSHKEIADHLDISESSSRSLVSRGRKMIVETFQHLKVAETKRLEQHENRMGFKTNFKII